MVPMPGVGGLDGDLTMSRIQLPATRPQRPPWNKGRLIGQKRPLLPRQVWAIRARLELADNLRDLALFNLAIDSKLRGCDLVRLRVVDLVAGGSVRDRVSVVQSKTGRPVQFEVSENTRKSVLSWVTSRPCLVRCSCSPAGSTAHHTSPRDSTHVSFMIGCVQSGSIQADMARIPQANQGRADLSENRQPASGSAPAWPYQGG
jgi:integrase